MHVRDIKLKAHSFLDCAYKQSLLRSVLDTLKAGDIPLGDAFYATYFLMCTLHNPKAQMGVFEQQDFAAT